MTKLEKDLEYLKNKRSKLKEKEDYIRNNTDQFVQEKINDIEDTLPNLDYHETADGERCVKEHFEYDVEAWKRGGETIALDKADRISERLNRIDNQIARLEDRL